MTAVPVFASALATAALIVGVPTAVICLVAIFQRFNSAQDPAAAGVHPLVSLCALIAGAYTLLLAYGAAFFAWPVIVSLATGALVFLAIVALVAYAVSGCLKGER
jgi:hypothetical protein